MRRLLVLVVGAAAACSLARSSPEGAGFHPEGWADRTSMEFHATWLRANKEPLGQCQVCHGQDFGGGDVSVSCTSSQCHTKPPTSCSTCHGTDGPRVDRDFAIMLHEWSIAPGTARPNPAVMTDFNIFTFNHRAWPGTAPLVVRTGQRVRLRLGNLSMDSHPIHLHGVHFEATATDGGKIPPSARFPENTVDVPVGATRDIEWIAESPGDWPLHCHKSHHTMNAMSHDLPVMIGVKQGSTEERVRKVLPTYMAMGETGMGGMMEMGRPKNTLPMMTGTGPFGPIEMGGMFTVVKVRDDITTYEDPGWYKHPAGSVAYKLPKP
jgi:hypothetical protein